MLLSSSAQANAAQGLLTSDASRIGVDMEPRTAARETASWWKRQPVLVEHSRGTLNGKRAKQRVASVTIPHQYFLGKISKCFTMAHTALTVLYAGQGKTGGCESDDDAHMGDDPEQRAQIATAQQTKL